MFGTKKRPAGLHPLVLVAPQLRHPSNLRVHATQFGSQTILFCRHRLGLRRKGIGGDVTLIHVTKLLNALKGLPTLIARVASHPADANGSALSGAQGQDPHWTKLSAHSR